MQRNLLAKKDVAGARIREELPTVEDLRELLNKPRSEMVRKSLFDSDSAGGEDIGAYFTTYVIPAVN